MSMKYQHGTTKIFLINYHIIWCPKYRKKILVGEVKKCFEDIIHEIAIENNWTIIALEIMPDHLHLFVSATPDVTPYRVVKVFKGRSSRLLRDKFPELHKLPTLWTRSYFISTAGNVSNDTIQKYIKMQSKV